MLLRFYRLASGPCHARFRGLAALCSVQIFVIHAQSCTTEKPPPLSRPPITLTNNYYLGEIGFAPQNCAQANTEFVFYTPLRAQKCTTTYQKLASFRKKSPRHPAGRN
jgi:hypothetical protein